MLENCYLPIVSFTTDQTDEPVGIDTTLFIQQDLYFGRDIPGGGRVSNREFQAFVDEVISPRVIGLTQFDATGQVRNPDGSINKERSNVITLLLEDTPENAAVVSEVLNAYTNRFNGAGILQSLMAMTSKSASIPPKI